MIDTQNQPDSRNIPVDQVGVSGIKYPIRVKDRSSGFQETVALVDMSVELLPEFKGTHMSRFVEILNKYRGEVTMANIPDILKEMRKKLESPRSMISLQFPYFIEKTAPVSKAKSLFPVDVLFSGYGSKKLGENFILGVRVPVTTLCPCSKEISRFGAHNQRSFVTVYMCFDDFIWIEDIIKWVEDCASCEIYPILKRSDEKFVTEKSFMHPQFAEDIVRNLTERLAGDANISWFMVETLHLESIHQHNAYARIERTRNDSILLAGHLQVFKGFRQ